MRVVMLAAVGVRWPLLARVQAGCSYAVILDLSANLIWLSNPRWVVTCIACALQQPV